MESTSLPLLSFGKNYRQVLRIVGAVIAFLLTLYALYSLISLGSYMSFSYGTDIFQIAGSVFWFLSCFLRLIGFCALGVILLVKADHIVLPLSLVIIALSCLTNAVQNICYLIWQLEYMGSYAYISSYPYLAYIFLDLLSLLVWALPAVAGFVKNKTTFQNLALIFLILPAVLFLINMVIPMVTNAMTPAGFLVPIATLILQCCVGLVVLCKGSAPRMAKTSSGGQKRQSSDHTVSPGRNTTTAAPNQSSSEYHMHVAILILLCFVTFGIYLFIWIYKTSKFISNALGREQFSPGIEVVLCIFVPFYFIYWVYKQSKNLNEINQTQGNYNSTDLSVINLLLTIFALSIVAIALMQDQVNKLCQKIPFTTSSYSGSGQTPNVYQNQSYAYQNQQNTYQNQQVTYGNTGTPPQSQLKFSSNTQQVPMTANADITQLETIKMLKKLLDEGVLTQEEFDKKKKDILGI